MPRVGWDCHPVTGSEGSRLYTLEFEPRFTRHEQHELGFVLIVPMARRGTMPSRNDPFDARGIVVSRSVRVGGAITRSI